MDAMKPHMLIKFRIVHRNQRKKQNKTHLRRFNAFMINLVEYVEQLISFFIEYV